MYLDDGAEVTLTSNIWPEAGIHNCSKEKVLYFIYQDANGPRNGELPKAVVVKFYEVQEDIQPLLPNIPRKFAKPVLIFDWRNYRGQKSDGIFIRKQVPLMIAWDFTIHKSQGKTLYRAVINLGENEKYSGMNLVALYCIRKFVIYC